MYNIFNYIYLLYDNIITKIALKMMFTKNFIFLNFWSFYIICTHLLFYIMVISYIYVLYKLIIAFPGFYFYPMPVPEANSIIINRTNLNDNVIRLYLQLLPENFNLREGGILTMRPELGAAYGRGVEIILPGDDRVDYHLFSTELFQRGLVSYANIRRMPTATEIGFYNCNPFYFRDQNYSSDAFNFFHTFMSDHFPDKILIDSVNRHYFIVDDIVVLQFGIKYLYAGWQPYDLVMLFNNIDPTHYGMVCRTPEIAQHVIEQNDIMFNQSLEQYKYSVNCCITWLGIFAVFTAYTVAGAYINQYYPGMLPINF